jgi:hypothetical protein
MAQVKVFGLGGIGSPCCCGGSCMSTICIRSACDEGISLPGVFVQVSSGSTTVASGTTGSNGCVTLNIGTAGTYTVQYQIPGGSLIDDGNNALTCGGTLTIIESDTVDFVCCGSGTGSCPIPRTLTLTDANGSYPFIFSSTIGGWQCCGTPASVTVMTQNGNQDFCECTGTVSGTIPILYTGACVMVDGVPNFSVTRTWAGLSCTVSAPYNYANISLGSVCQENVNACFFSTNPANPFNNTSGLTQVWSSCSPFTWSGALTLTGGFLPDPVGGTVAVSP